MSYNTIPTSEMPRSAPSSQGSTTESTTRGSTTEPTTGASPSITTVHKTASPSITTVHKKATPSITTVRKREKPPNPYVTIVFALTGFIFFVAFVVFTRAYWKCKPTHSEEDQPAEQHTSRPCTGVTDAEDGKTRGRKATTDTREGRAADTDGLPSGRPFSRSITGGVVYAELCHNEQPKATKKRERTNMVIPPRYEPVTYAHIDNLRQELEMKNIGHPSHQRETYM